MKENFFQEIGKELDTVLNDINTKIKEDFNEEEFKNKINDFSEYIVESSLLFEDIINSVYQEKPKKKSKYKKFQISFLNPENSEITYIKNESRLKVNRKGTDRSFYINLVNDISEKNIIKIFNNISYDKDKNLIIIKVKKKLLS